MTEIPTDVVNTAREAHMAALLESGQVGGAHTAVAQCVCDPRRDEEAK